MAKKKPKKKPKKGTAKKAAEKAIKKRTKVQNVGGASAADKKLLKEASEAVVRAASWHGVVEGDSIVGECLSYEKDQPSRFGPKSRLILGHDDGASTVWCNKSLEEGCDEAGIEPGDRVAIVYKGSVPTKGRGAPFKLYSVTAAKGTKRQSKKLAKKTRKRK